MEKAISRFASFFHPPALAAGGSVCIPSLTGAADAFVALSLTNAIPSTRGQSPRFASARGLSPCTEGLSPHVVLAVTPGIPDAERLADDLRLLTAKSPTRVLEFPPLLDGDKSSLGIRLKTLAALRAWGLSPYPCVIVVPFPALAAPIPAGSVPPIVLGTVPLKMLGTVPQKLGSVPAAERGTVPVRFSDICSKLAEIGYERKPTVEREGDFSVRGGIVDAWSPGEEFPVRAEFFGDDLESLRRFDVATQMSVERLDTATILPIREGLSPSDGGLSPSDGGLSPSSEGLSPSSGGLSPSRRTKTLIDVLPPGFAILAIEHNDYNLSSVIGDRPLSGGDRPPTDGDRPPVPIVYTGEPAPRGVPDYAFQTVPLPGFAELGADEAHHPELFEAARNRLEHHIAAARAHGDVVLALDNLSSGFELSSQTPQTSQTSRTSPPGLLVVTKADRVFTKKKARVPRGVPATGVRLDDFDDLEPGEYVVHVDYGVGRFIGSSEILTDGHRREVYTIEYADGAKLHVPAAHAHLLSRYVGAKGEAVHLHRLDGKRWDKDKQNAQKAIQDLAASLLETQARRETTPGFAYDIACDGLDAFEAAFPYEETPDQSAAITAVKKDLAARKPMDRLVCGDAGYGKTEVAMRAAYIAALNGKQVAVLAPTTVLAEQHFETFTARFDGTPVRIESVSRFQSAGTHDGTFRRLATGVCDIVIGTHAILSSKIAFRDLGLVIIDEEQRFGVRHKEFLKRLRATADVLTLSATPIPRTLYLSMTGARDFSLLRTPPRERVAVDTKIVTDSDEIVRAAIESEIARGGQVFFLHNRVSTIGRVEKRLAALCPRARTVVAHGQMDAKTLARKMRAFERGEYDVLLSTTIVESGIDIPRANTILVDHAEMFGLADLYQLRGRVGRSAREGRAVFLLPTGGLVDSDARERLAALKRHGGLGAGYNLAVRDLELRGAGNLLGAQQSGHIAAIGFGLYCQLLKRTVARLKGEKMPDLVDVRLNLDFVELSPGSADDATTAALPYSYVEEDALRMSFMKRFAEASDRAAVKALAIELEDRFGPLPSAAKRLVRIAELRVACAAAGIGNVDAQGPRAIFYRAGTREIRKVIDLRGKSADRKIGELLKAVLP